MHTKKLTNWPFSNLPASFFFSKGDWRFKLITHATNLQTKWTLIPDRWPAVAIYTTTFAWSGLGNGDGRFWSVHHRWTKMFPYSPPGPTQGPRVGPVADAADGGANFWRWTPPHDRVDAIRGNDHRLISDPIITTLLIVVKMRMLDGIIVEFWKIIVIYGCIEVLNQLRICYR